MTTELTWQGREKNNPAHDMLVAFFVLDIQGNTEWVIELKEKVSALQSGEISSWERIGNAYHLSFSADKVIMEDEVDDSSYHVSLDEFQAALNAYSA